MDVRKEAVLSSIIEDTQSSCPSCRCSSTEFHFRHGVG